jgi:predicted secreted Zn-dependent protease
VVILYDVKVILPRWVNIEEASMGDIWWWESTMQYFARHEEVHVQIVNNNVDMVQKAVSEATCETVEEEFNKAYQYIQDLQKEFDEKVKNENQ